MNKLVRDNIPKIIEEEGRTQKSRLITGYDLHLALAAKLVEESREVLEAITDVEDNHVVAEEMADLIEVFDALKNQLQLTENIMIQRDKKARLKGKFDKGVFLEEVK